MSMSLTSIAARIVTITGCTFPRTSEKIDRLVGDTNASTGVVTAVLASDPVLTALALGRANATSQTSQLQVTNAVMLLGLGTLQGLMRDVVPIPLSLQKSAAAYWAQANACATMCRILGFNSPVAQRMKMDSDVLHVVGLLHNLGSIISLLHFPDEYQRALEVATNDDQWFATALKQELGADPSEVGALLASSWNLPPLLAKVIRHHAAPGDVDIHVEMVNLAHLAHILVLACGFTAPGSEYCPAIDEKTLAVLELNPQMLGRILEQFFDDLEEMELFEGMLSTTKEFGPTMSDTTRLIPNAGTRIQPR